MRIDGACHCGRIRFSAEVDPARVIICHCTDCQALTGTAFRVSVPAGPDDLAIEGEPRVYVKTAQSGRARRQYFCGHCGSPLFTNGSEEDPGSWGVRWGVIRRRDQLVPTRQIWRRSAASWVCAFDDATASATE